MKCLLGTYIFAGLSASVSTQAASPCGHDIVLTKAKDAIYKRVIETRLQRNPEMNAMRNWLEQWSPENQLLREMQRYGYRGPAPQLPQSPKGEMIAPEMAERLKEKTDINFHAVAPTPINPRLMSCEAEFEIKSRYGKRDDEFSGSISYRIQLTDDGEDLRFYVNRIQLAE